MNTHKRQRRFKKPFIIVLLIGVFFFVLFLRTPSSISFLQKPATVTGTFFSHIWSTVTTSEESLSAKNKKLESQLISLALEQSELESLRFENEDLKKQLNYFERNSHDHITASVIARSVNPTNSSITLNKGESDGVHVGLPVIVSDGVLIGKVSQVSANASSVKLINDRQSDIAATVLNNSRTLGVIKGTKGVLLSMDFIPQDEVIQVDELVVTSGLEQYIPPGLLIGIINAVHFDPATPFQEATVEPLINYRLYNVMSIIIPETSL